MPKDDPVKPLHDYWVIIEAGYIIFFGTGTMMEDLRHLLDIQSAIGDVKRASANQSRCDAEAKSGSEMEQ